MDNRETVLNPGNMQGNGNVNRVEGLIEEQIKSLRIHHDAIVKDLDPDQIIPFLLTNLVLSHDDKQRLEHEITISDKAVRLLNMLEKKALKQKNPDLIKIFVESLQREYYWLYDVLIKPLAADDDVPDSFNPGHHSNQEKVDDNIFNSPKHHKMKHLLEHGGVTCPVVAVERKSLVEAVRQELELLQRNQFLVIRGMAGCGKSILAKQALNSAKLVKNMFPDGVFWMSVGRECSESKDALLTKMGILCEKMEETRAPMSLEHGTDLLRSAFLKRPKSLLVLDGVLQLKVIRCLDVGCPIMVTTRDVSVMDAVTTGRYRLIQIDPGFSEAESLELFCKSLNFERVEDLPEGAKQIHLTSKGSPMVVSLISSLFEDHRDDVRDEGRWAYYADKLSKRRYSRIRRHRDYEHETIYDALSLSAYSIPEIDRQYYYDFALFQDNVGIPSPVLEVIWSKDRYAVGDIMTQLVKKSLIGQELNPGRNWHVYSIHSLQLDYLKYKLQQEDSREETAFSEQNLHDRLISAYLHKVDTAYDKFPDDDYIHFYLGYHLYKSRRLSLFPEIYLNLLFIGQKLRIAGPADVLMDFRKYREFIVGDSEERGRLFDEMQSFVELMGYVLHGQDDVDIVQLALQNPNFKLLEERARKLALIQPCRLYFEWIGADPSQWKDPESTIVTSGGVQCVKFVGSSGNHFLVGLNDGTIELCDLNSCGVIWKFVGHTDKIYAMDTFDMESCKSKLAVNDPKVSLIFVSASEDKNVKVWTALYAAICEGNRCYLQRSRSSSPSPKIRSSPWNFEKIEDKSSYTFEFHTAPVLSVKFSPNGTEVLSASFNEILVWSIRKDQLGVILYKNSMGIPGSPTGGFTLRNSFLDCQFILEQSLEDKFSATWFLVGAGNTLSLYSMQQPAIFTSTEASNMSIVGLLFYSNDEFCLVSVKDVSLWKVEQGLSDLVPRRKSLSPRRSFAMTGFPSIPSINSTFPSHGGGDVTRTNGSGGTVPVTASYFAGGHHFAAGSQRSLTKSSPSKYSLTSSSPVAFLDTGERFVRIIRERVLNTRRTTGLFRAASVSVSDRQILLACATSTTKICLYNLSTTDYLGEFNTHSGLLRCLDFSTVDEWTMLSGSEDQTVKVWDIKSESSERRTSQKRHQFSSIYVQNIPTGSEPDFFYSVFSTEANTIQFYRDSILQQETCRIRSEISVVNLSPCGRHVVFGTESGVFYQMQLDAVSKFATIPEPIGDVESRVQALKFDLTSRYLIAVSTAGIVQILKDFNIHREQFHGHSNLEVVGIHFPFGNFCSIIYEGKGVPTLMLQLESGNFDLRFLNGPAWSTCSALRNDSGALAIGTKENGIFLFSWPYGAVSGLGLLKSACLSTKHKSTITTIAFSSDGSRLGIGYRNGMISIWSTTSNGHYKESQNLVLHKAPIRFLLFSPLETPDRQWLISVGDRLAIWSLDQPIEQLQRTSFMSERRRRKSGDSRSPTRLSLELPSGIKIGKQGKRELLNSFTFRGTFVSLVICDPSFTKFLSVDDTGIFYFLRIMKEP